MKREDPSSGNPPLLLMPRKVAAPGTGSGEAVKWLRWLMAAAGVVPVLMFAALAWQGYGRTVEQTRQALLETSRVLNEHAANVLRIGPVRADTDEFTQLEISSHEYFDGFYRDVAGPRTDLTIALLRSTGEVMASYPNMRAGARSYDQNGPVMKAISAGMTNGVVDGPSTLENAYRLAAFRQVGSLPFYVVVSRTSRSVLAEWRHDVFTHAAFVGPMALALMLAVWLASRRARKEHDALIRWHEETLRRSQAEDQLRQFEKYEALGELTGGIAHDFNNLLNIVSTNATVISLLPKGADLRPHLAALARAAANGSALTKHLLAFARKQPLTFVRINTRETLPAICDLARHSLPKTIELRCEVAVDVHDLMADAAELELAIINMTVNARDAMPHGGVITVRADNVPAGTADPGEVPDTRHYVAISISDTGTGIPEDLLGRIFEPFFTTKKEKGTGLGLSRVYGYARQLGGSVTARNLANGGAMLMLYIPAVERAADEAQQLKMLITGHTTDSSTSRT